MKITLIKVSSTIVILASTALPVCSETNGLGADYLMTHTLIDSQSVSSKNRSKPRALAQSTPASSSTSQSESTANLQEFPTQILKTGVILTTTGLSPNSMQLCESIGLTPVLERITALRDQAAVSGGGANIQALATKQDLREATQSARMILQRASLEVDSTEAEIEAEKQIYNEILNTFKNDRDKAIARTNAFAFISNGILWAVTESFVIPAYKYPVYNVPAGIVGIPAGVLPSVASMYVFKQINGKRKTSEVEPNMLAKLFNYPTNPEIEYPRSVWTYLNQVPADSPNAKKRLDQIIDRWIADANMPTFTDRHSKKQLDVITASVSHKKALTIKTLTARTVMLDQLVSELMKMKRMLLELNLVVIGDKRFVADRGTQPRI